MQLLRPIIFFDRDGTLTVDLGYTHRPQDLRWRAGAVEAIKAVNDRGWLAVVVTNQAGVARGYYDETDVARFHARMQSELEQAQARLDAFYYCPFHADAVDAAYRHPDHPERKPNPGMLRRAFAELPADPKRALIIGDQDIDLAAGRAIGIACARASEGSLLHVLEAALAELSWSGDE